MFGRIAELESAVLAALKEEKPAWLRFVGSYGGELAGDWEAVVRAVPAYWLAFSGMTEPKPLNTAQTRFEAVIQLSLVAASRSVASEAASRHGAPGSAPGTYAMLAHAASLLCMRDFGLDGVDYLRPGRIRTLFSAQVQGKALSVLAQDWRARIVFVLREPGQRPVVAPGEQDTPAGYLTPDAPPLPELTALDLRYWLKPPRDPEHDDPLLVDSLRFPLVNIFQE
ncbi:MULTISPECIES: phage protein Gp37 [unclassified Desulfovibrio]|uniref:phage protein Gp37 n=1 Tax=unclassified Desulfovibrio TaxID=2593640 RepID=UPI0013EB67A9|nr:MULTISPECIES: phage protein Gp37 [unclassified Desulfovibrio]